MESAIRSPSLNLLLRICDFVFVLRPLILLPAWSFFLIGAFEGRPGFTLPRPAAFLSLTAISMVAYLVNQIFDRESDEKNQKCFYLWQGLLGVRTLLMLALAALVVAAWSFTRADPDARGLLVVLLVLSLLYSVPPVRLCARPFVDALTNAAGYGGISYLLGRGFAGESAWIAVWQSTPFVFLVGATFIHTAIPDVSGDRATGKLTTAVALGERAIPVASVLHVLAVVTAIASHNGPAMIVTLVSLPLSAYVLVKRTVAASSAYAQGATLVVTLYAAVTWPPLMLVALSLFALSRFYHRRRFGINYPGRRETA